jgi:hypothetical protein
MQLLLTDALIDLDEPDQVALVVAVNVHCIKRFPVMSLLLKYFPERIDEIRSSKELVAATFDHMEYLDRTLGADEVCLLLPDYINPRNFRDLAAYTAAYARDLLRFTIPEEIGRLDRQQSLAQMRADLEKDFVHLLTEDGSQFSNPSVHHRWVASTSVQRMFIQLVQVNRFTTDKDLELWDLLAAVEDLREHARRGVGLTSWNYEKIADYMTFDPAIPSPHPDRGWTAQEVERVAARLETAMDHYRTMNQLEQRKRNQEIVRRQRLANETHQEN